MAVFCDFENVALGVRDAKIDRFDIKPVLERLLLKGNIVVKKAYCDWERYKGFKASMHEASFELIEIPHVRQSGKNSADIRLVVDALDLCYTKSHVDTFVIVSGDSDFSPLVSKLRENAKKVIGVGVKHSTSDLLVANCDEFIFYDDLVRELARGNARRESSAKAARVAGDERQPKAADTEERKSEERKSKAIALAVETLDALVLERGDSGKIWASVLKSAIKRRRPDFNETRYGFRAFGNLLDEAQARGLLEVGRDEKSGTYVSRTSQPAPGVGEGLHAVAVSAEEAAPAVAAEAPRAKGRGRGKGRRNGQEVAGGDEGRDGAHAGAGLEHHHERGDGFESAEAHEHAAASAHAAQTALPFGEAQGVSGAAERQEWQWAHEPLEKQEPQQQQESRGRRGSRGSRGSRQTPESRETPDSRETPESQTAGAEPMQHAEAQTPAADEAPAASRRPRKTASRKTTARKTTAAQPAADTPAADTETATAAKKPASRTRRTRTKATPDAG